MSDALKGRGRLEAHCHASTQRCAALEHSLARLEHDLTARISHWDAQLSSLRSVDDRARALTAQLTTQLAALRGAATPQVASAKAAVVESARRVDESDELLGRSAGSIEQARETLDELQRVFKQNQATLERAQSWESWFSWFAIVAAAVCIALLAWFVPRFTGDDARAA
ncbi:hypothetical protein JCM10450v2_003873 [Rhodotorula kratochvilovae]